MPFAAAGPSFSQAEQLVFACLIGGSFDALHVTTEDADAAWFIFFSRKGAAVLTADATGAAHRLAEHGRHKCSAVRLTASREIKFRTHQAKAAAISVHQDDGCCVSASSGAVLSAKSQISTHPLRRRAFANAGEKFKQSRAWHPSRAHFTEVGQFCGSTGCSRHLAAVSIAVGIVSSIIITTALPPDGRVTRALRLPHR